MNKNECDNNENEAGLSYYLKHKWKFGVTLFCLFSFITMGLHLEISGSTMLPLSIQVGVNISQISWIIAARSFGYMISIVFFGVIFQSLTKNHSEFLLTIGYLFPAAATALTPYLKSLWTLCVALLFQGILHGLSDLAINTLITRMWLNRSTAPLNCVYLGYAIGALFSTILVRSFRENDLLINNQIKDLNSTNLSRENQFQSNLIGPYIIISIFCLISSIGFGFITYKERIQKKKEKLSKVRIYQSVAKEEINIESKPKRLFNKGKFWKTCSPTTCGQGYLAYGFILFSLILLYNFFFGGIEQGFTKFFVPFLEEQEISLNKKDALYGIMFYWIPMLIGRILCTFLTVSWLSPEILLTISLFFCLLTYLFWMIFIWYIGLNRLIIYLLVIINGLSISSISPTTIGWLKQFLNLTPIELSFILSSNAIGGIIFPLISGYIFQYYSSKHLFTLLILLSILTSILFILSSIIQYYHSKHHLYRQNQEQTIFIKHNQQLTSDDYPTIEFIDQE